MGFFKRLIKGEGSSDEYADLLPANVAKELTDVYDEMFKIKQYAWELEERIKALEEKQ